MCTNTNHVVYCRHLVLTRHRHGFNNTRYYCRRIVPHAGKSGHDASDSIETGEEHNRVVGENTLHDGEGQRSSSLGRIMSQYAVPDVAMAKQMGLDEELFEGIMELPGTTDVKQLKSRLLSLATWNSKLSKGSLPKANDVSWPEEPFRSSFLDTLRKLGMARFTQKHPKLLGSLMKQFMQMAKEFEIESMNNNTEQQDFQNPESAQPPMQNRQQESVDPQDSQEAEESGSGPSQGDQDMEPAEDMEQGDVSREEQQLEVDMDQSTSEMTEDVGEDDGESSGFAEELAEKMLQKFEEEWSPALEALEAAEDAFDDIDPLLDGPEGFDASEAVWHHTGWKQLASLRKKLENLKELRDLVRSLGRGGGKGPIRRAPQQIYSSNMPAGVIRSEESPEETRGLTRSGDISRMLPIEARLLVSSRIKEKLGSAPTVSRRLFMARRAERMLLSYERTGWVENEPTRVTDRLELRPASEMGPIIVCLDTSASMLGPRETVAKSLTLECMRGAIRQQRKCIVYAFSGPENVMEIELDIGSDSITKLLGFLTMSFSGGTDVDAPLALSLERLGREEWNLADILMVTDGEIPHPDEDILRKLNAAKEDLGLSVHGLLVGRVTEPMEQICSDIHVFSSWNVVDPSIKNL